MEPDQFLTVAEVAEILKLNRQTLRNWIDAGTLPAIHVGRRVRIRRSDFDALVQEGYRRAKPTEPSEPSPNLWDGEIAPPEVP